MGDVLVLANGLGRDFRVSKREPGLGAAMRSVVRRSYRTVEAIHDLNFAVNAGEIVSFLGPNGAGKTTTLKCIAGLLTPTSGTIDVLGFEPAARDERFLGQLGFVMGQRWQLHVDLPVSDSFELSRVIYGIDRTAHERAKNELVELLSLDDLLWRPARELSLGQRMRCEFANSLLHRPRVVLLDEPTLGLDFDAQAQIRSFVRSYADRSDAAVLLTSHYLADIEALSDRVLTIANGRITFEGTLDALREHTGGRKRVTIVLSHPLDAADFSGLGSVIEQSPIRVVLDVPRDGIGAALGAVERIPEIIDLTITEPPLEESLADLYQRGTP